MPIINGMGRWGVKAKTQVIIPGNDTDAQAFITAAGITDTTQQSAINTLVTNLKGYGIWSKMKAIYPMVGGTATAHKFNLKNPADTNAAFRLGFFGGWTHTSTGAKPNGTTAYADTFLNTATVIGNANDGHLTYYSRTNNSGTNQIEIGNRDSNSSFDLVLKFGASNLAGACINMSDSNVFTNNTSSTGFYHANQNNTANVRKMFKNGAILATQTVAQNVQPSEKVFIGARGGVSSGFFSSRECAFASVGNGLTDTEAANFYTAVQIFQSTLGRQEGVPIVSDTDAQAFLNAAVITNTTQASAVNTLVTSLKSYGLWDKMKAIYPMVGGTAASHKFNLKQPEDGNYAYRMLFFGGWTHTSTGAKPNGTNAYAETYLNALSSLTNNNYHISHYSRTQKITGPEIDLVANGFGTVKMIAIDQYYGGAGKAFVAGDYNTSLIINSDTNTLGMVVGSRTSQTSAKLFMNGVQKGSTLTLSNPNALPNNTFHLGANGIANEYSSKECAFATIGDGLTDTEVANLYTAVHAFQTTLGRQVDGDAQAFITAAGITDTTQQSAINTLVTNLKGYGIWSKMKAIYPMVGGTATAHKFNLKNPADTNAAFRLGFYGGMTHNSNGVSFGGANGGAFTYFNPFTTQAKNNLHLSLYTRTRPTRGVNFNDINMLSGYGEIGWTALRATSNSANSEYFGTSDTAEGVAILSNSTSVGFSLGSRTSSTAIKYYKNTTSASGTGGVHNNDFKNAALTLNGNASNSYSAGQYAFASLGDGLTDAEAANFYTAVQAFQTTLGRQV